MSAGLRRGQLWLALLTLAFVYLLSYSGVLHAVDEQSALSVTESMLLGQGFHVNQMVWDQERTPPQNIAGVDGNLYSKKGIGPSLLALPLFWLGKQSDAVGAVQIALLSNLLVTLLAAGAMFGLALALNYRSAVALAGLFLLGLATPLWPYARTLFSESLAAAGLAVALWGAIAFRRTADGTEPAQRGGGRRWLWLAGAGLALLLLAKSSNAVVAPAFGIYLLWVWLVDRRGRTDWRQIAAQALSFAVLPTLAIALTVAYNFVRFHTLFSFPLEPYEQFSTPLLVGLAGLLLSPGKGIFWYMPCLWLAPFFVGQWRRSRRVPDFLLALAAAAAIIVFYALWYDWPGGRSWGPRMIMAAVPALAMLVLPALDWLLAEPAGARRWTWARVLAAAVLVWSVVVQVEGILVNFERQEALDMQAGATFAQLVWGLPHSPLLTYWLHWTPAVRDPLWLQPYLAARPLEWAAIGGLALLAALLLGAAWRALRRGRQAVGWLTGAALALLGLAGLLAVTALPDPRWDELSAVREDNAALLQLVDRGERKDLVLLDLTAQSDAQRRSGLWLNRAGLQPYLGWPRQAVMAGPAADRLQRWLAPYRRVWLALEATDEGDPASTTERWLDSWAFAGQRGWLGSQRYVEYLLPQAKSAPQMGPYRFGSELELGSYALELAPARGAALVTLAWSQPPLAPDLRYSVQALDATGKLVAQVDGVPGRAAAGAPRVDRVGLDLPPAFDRLLLKVYHAADGAVVPVTAAGGSAAEFLELKTQ